MRTLRLASAAYVGLFAAALSAQGPGPDIDKSFLRNYPAGPFSSVNTSYGGLETNIPLFELEGNGGTALSFSIRHRSNITTGTSYLQRGIGKGWFHSYESVVRVNGADYTQDMQGGGIQPWQAGSPVGGVYPRRQGTRDTLRDILNGGGTWIGWEAESLASKTKMQYFRLGADPIKFVAYLGAVVDPYGNAVEVFYDANKRVTRIDDASNVRYVTITYWDTTINSLIRYITLNYPGGTRQWELIHSSGNLTEVRWPITGTTDPRPIVRMAYDGNSNITDVYDFNGYRWHYAYATQPTQGPGTSPLACVSVHPPSPTAPTSNFWTWDTEFAWTFASIGGATFSDDEKICTILEPYGSYASPLVRQRYHKYYFNTALDTANGGNQWVVNPIKRIQDPIVDGLNFWESYVWYYGDGTLRQYRDRRDKAYDFTYDTTNLGLVFTSKTPANGYSDALRTTNYFYDPSNRLVLTDAPGRSSVQRLRTAQYYNAQHSPIKTIVDPKVNPLTGLTEWPAGLDITSQATFTAQGELASTWSGTDFATTSSNFDAYGSARTITSPDAKVTTLTFDSLGNKTGETPPAPFGTTTFTYDNLSRLTRTDYPGVGFAATTYDAASNPILTIDENGFSTSTTFDFMNRVWTVSQQVDATLANDLVTTNAYDPSGNLVSTTNPRGKLTTHVYDARDNRRTTTYPDLKTRQWTYDGDGRIGTGTDGKLQVTAFLYNDAGQLTNEQRKNGVTVVYQTVYTYNPDGNRTTMVDASSATATNYSYDTASRVTSTFQPIPNKTVAYSYDASGRKSTMSVFPGNTTAGTPLMKWTYLHNSGLRLQTLKEKLGSGTEVNLATFTYYDAGLMNLRSNFNGTSATYGYDDRGQLGTITHKTGTTVHQTLGYVYDLGGAITTYTHQTLEGMVNNTATTAYTHDRSYRLLTEGRTGSVHAGQNFTVAYNYDKNGNRTSTVRNSVSSTYTVDDNDKLLSGDGFTFSAYDNNGSPTTVVSGGVTYTFVYTRDNAVASTAYSTGGTDTFLYDGDGRRIRRITGGVTTNFVYDGDTMIAEYPGVLATYHVPGISYTESTGTRYYYRENGLGSTVGVLNSSGVLASRSEYDAYGQELVIQAGAKSNLRFAGKHGYYKDDSSGLTLLGARYYSAKLGRFLTQDPIGHGGGLNLYRYCNDSPLGCVDPTGTAAVVVNGTAIKWYWRAIKHIGSPTAYRALYKDKKGNDRMNFHASCGNSHAEYTDCGRFVYQVVSAELSGYPPVGTTTNQLPYLRNSNPDVSIATLTFKMGGVRGGGMQFMDILIKNGHTGFFVGKATRDGKSYFTVLNASLGGHAPIMEELPEDRFYKNFDYWARPVFRRTGPAITPTRRPGLLSGG